MLNNQKDILISHYRPLNKPPEYWSQRMMEVVQAMQASQDTLEALIEVGADPNYHHPVSGETPLLASLKMSRASFALELLRRGADVNGMNNGHETPLMYAAKLKITRVIDVLLQGGADFKALDNQGHSVLSYAAFSEDRAVFDRMLALYDAPPVAELEKACHRTNSLSGYIKTIIATVVRQQRIDGINKAFKGGVTATLPPQKSKFVLRRKNP